MSEPLPFVAFASPDGGPWGLALGHARVLSADQPAPAADDIERLLAAAGEEMAPGTVGEAPALMGRLPHPGGGESVRLAVALFGAGRLLALTALRPRRARGHDRDVIEAVIREDEPTRPIDDPRFSVTLDSAGSPLRVGLELWPAAADEESYEFPRRAAGEPESASEPLELASGDVRAVAHRMRWRSRGEDGAGWFVLARAR